MPSRKSMPIMKWHPETGKSQIFDHPDDAPAGYVDEHPNNMEPADRKAAVAKLRNEKKTKGEAPKPLTRKEVIASLTDGGIEFDGNAETPALEKTLADALKVHLTEAGVEFEADADTRTLLTMVPKTKPE